MDLQISVFLLFILFTAGHSLSCNLCASSSCTQQTCSNGSTNCFGLTTVVNTTITKLRGCNPASTCANGSLSFGSVKASTSCCNTDLCNSQDAPEPSNTTNVKKCFSCDGTTIKNCTNVLSCSGTEDRCFTVTDVNQTAVVKGCATKSVCDAATAVATIFNLANATCCDGNLCNGAQSVSQSFLFLCCSLLSYFLLH
ncbi:phospholipase A2 inhibitor and Ly6/PLAUR domain-containing protein-like [Megalobrama amblycephala]|uniref:phospholipase A2 inhibitor and Ly6/PLAUR domain-containing protein-like n=1 Tax=Megalobrama amblycephala TaxID=75352 RepID=UPI002013FFD8|nr:phospholipase A2 inhibitor and Ly6/PLAUR domain-containing protein-like [Megalobrama amblycephala]